MKAEALAPKTLATWTCAIRKSSHWSQEALAAACGLDVRTIQRIEAGEPSSISTRRQLARGLGYENQNIFEDPEFFRKLNEILRDTAEAAQAEELKKHYPDHIKIKIERVKNGDALGRFADLTSASVFQADDTISQEAKEAAASLFDYVRDLTDVSSDVSFTDKMEFNKELGGKLSELESMGTAVYSGFRHTEITGEHWKDTPPCPSQLAICWLCQPIERLKKSWCLVDCHFNCAVRFLPDSADKITHTRDLSWTLPQSRWRVSGLCI